MKSTGSDQVKDDVEKSASGQPTDDIGIEKWDEEIILSYGRFVRVLPKLASGTLGLAVVAYLIGWIRAESYYSAFGAGWITKELTSTELLGFSAWPLVLLVISFVVTMTDIATRLVGKSLRKAEYFSLGFVLVGLSAALGCSWFGNRQIAAKIAWLSMYYSSCLLMLTFGKIVLGLHSNRFEWQSSFVWILLWGSIFYGANCRVLGIIEGNRDNDPAYSELPVVTLGDSKVGDWRLLLSSDQTMYVADIADKTNSPTVRVLGADRVMAVKRRVTNLKNK